MKSNSKFPKIKFISIPIIGLFFLTLAIFCKVLGGGQTFFVGDILTQYYPVRYFIQKWLSQNFFPYWCPQIFNGFAVLASSNSGIFNPLERIIFYFFSPVYAYNLNIAAHFFLGAVGMYALVKHLTREPAAAFLASVSFVFSGFFFVYLTYVTIFSMCYLPLVFLLCLRCFNTQRFSDAAKLALILGLQLFAGGAQYVFYTLLALALLALFMAVKSSNGIKRFSPVYFLTLAVAGFLLFAAVQIIPTLELIGHSIRSQGVDEAVWKTASFPLRHLITILIPHYWGEMYRFGVYKGEYNFIDLNCYLGIVPLLLAAIPLFMKKRPDLCNFFYFLLAFSFFMALGKFNPLYHFLYRLPLFKTFRYPGRILVLAVFSIAVNAAFGFQAVMQNKEPKRLKVALFVITALWLILAAVIFVHLKVSGELHDIRLNGWLKMNLYFILGLTPLYWQLFKGMNRKFLFSWLVAVVLIDNLLFGYPFNPTINTEIMAYRPPVWQKMAADKNKYRVYAQANLPFSLIQRGRLTRSSDLSSLVRTNIEILQGNTVLLSEFNAYRGYEQLEFFRHRAVRENISTSLLAKSGVKYFLRWKNWPFKGHVAVFEGANSLIYQLPDAIPRAYFAADQIVIRDFNSALSHLESPGYDPLKQVILDEKPSSNQVDKREETLAQAAVVSLEEYGPNQVNIEVNAPRSGWLVLSDSYYPGWEAYVDGKRAKIYRANLLFRALPVSKGKHQVVYRYRPKSWFYGAMMSFVSLLGLSLMILFSALKNRTIN